MTQRKVKKVISGFRAVDGAGVKLVRVFSRSAIKYFDPFLLLDAFDSVNPADYIAGFPVHPHRGIETVTYLIHGNIEHKDSLGNAGSIRDGSCQWMTAGSGILHQEMPQPSERMLGLQLWINLPAKDKMVPPKYHNLEPNEIPLIKEPGAEVRILSGHYKNTVGAMEGDYVKATYLDLTLEPGKTWSITTNPDETVFIYIILGDLSCEPNEPRLKAHQAVLFTKGNQITFEAGPDGTRFVLLSGAPLKEPVAWSGSIVMNTEEELELAYEELKNNHFIKHEKPEK